MAEYGQMLDSNDHDMEKMYQDFDDYFNHPIMVKIKDVNKHSMYMSKMYCLLSNECRYIIVFVVQNNDQINIERAYLTFFWYFYKTKDKDGLIRATNRLKINNYTESASLNEIIDYLNKTGKWPEVKFE